MSENRPTQDVLRRLLSRLEAAQWLEMAPIVSDEFYSAALSEKGIERLKTLHPILLNELNRPSPDELGALLWLLDDAQKKHYPSEDR